MKSHNEIFKLRYLLQEEDITMTLMLRDICFQENKKFLFSLWVQKNGHTNRRTLDKATSSELETLMHMINCIQTGLLPIDPLHEKKLHQSGRNSKLQKFDLSVARMLSEDEQRTILKQFGSVYCFLLHRLFHDTPAEWVCDNEGVKLSSKDITDPWRMKEGTCPQKISLKGLKGSKDLEAKLQGSEYFLWKIFQEKDGHTNRRLLSKAKNQEINALWHIVLHIQEDTACIDRHNLAKIKKSGSMSLLKKMKFPKNSSPATQKSVLKKFSSVFCYLLHVLFVNSYK